jgi:signal transduction histidine kinase
MIASSLATANHSSAELDEKEEMFAIAAREAKRLEKITSDFLSYARPVKPCLETTTVGDILEHIAEVTKMRSTSRNIEVVSSVIGDGTAVVDHSKVEGALLNLSLNALDATPDHGRIELRSVSHADKLRIEVENSGAKIPEQDLKRIFEPFFTTKAGGTGLGLAIARGVAIAHGGDLYVSRNDDGAVVFTMTLAKEPKSLNMEETADGKDIDRR